MVYDLYSIPFQLGQTYAALGGLLQLIKDASLSLLLRDGYTLIRPQNDDSTAWECCRRRDDASRKQCQIRSGFQNIGKKFIIFTVRLRFTSKWVWSEGITVYSEHNSIFYGSEN